MKFLSSKVKSDDIKWKVQMKIIMKINFVVAALGLLWNSQLVFANEPLPEKTLAERVGLATHVIVGTAKNVKVVKYVQGKDGESELQDVAVQPKMINGADEFIEVDVDVDETLYANGRELPKTVRYIFGGGFFEVESVVHDTLNRQVIYLMSFQDDPKMKDYKFYFFPSYSWNLCESLKEEAEIKASLQTRLKKEADAREQNAKAQQPNP